MKIQEKLKILTNCLKKHKNSFILFVFIIELPIQSCKNETDTNDLLFGISEVSTLKDYLSINEDSDTCYVSWKMHNNVIGAITVFPINSKCDSLLFFSIDTTGQNDDILIYYNKDKFYIYKLNKVIFKDSAKVLIN